LPAKEKMKQMVSGESSNSQAEGLFVRGRIMERGSSSGSRGKSSNGYMGRSQSRGKSKKYCKYCKKSSHFISECYKLKNKEMKKDTLKPNGKTEDEGNASVAAESGSEGDVLVAFARCANIDDEWILNSACTFHICIHTEWFHL
jgi:hypothetical protein